MKKKISITIEESILKQIDELIDNLSIRNRSQAIEFLAKSAIGDKKTAIILSGGEEEKLKIGNNYSPSSIYKGKAVIERAVKKLRENNFKKIFIIARQSVLTSIFNILKDGSEFGAEIIYVEEKSSKGTADSLRLVKGKVNERSLVVYSDIIFDDVDIEDIWKSHSLTNAIATLTVITSSKPSDKGNVSMKGTKITEFIQKPKHSDTNLVCSPIFVVEPELFGHAGHSLETEVFPKLAEKGLLNGYVSDVKEKHIHSEKDLK